MTRQQRTVLIVDNSSEDRETYRQCLLADPDFDYTVLEEASGTGGLAVCRARSLDSILLEFCLPDLDGLKFLAELKADLEATHPPVVIVTGQGSEAIAVKAIKSGAEDYLVKGETTPEQLRLAVRSAIENADLRQELHRSEERFRVSIENMLDCFGIYSAIRDESGKIIDFQVEYVNAAACRSLQMSQEDQIGKRLFELIPDYWESDMFEGVCQVVETGEPLAKESFTYAKRDDTGLTRAFDIRITKLEDGFVSAWRDITEKKQAEEQLQQSQQIIQQIADAVPDLLYLYDFVENRNVYVNRQATKVFGYTQEQILSMGPELFLRLMHPADLARLPAYLEQFNTAKDSETFSFEYQMRHANGEWRWFYSQDTVFNRTAEGRPRQLLGTAQDITQRKRAELELSRINQRFERAAAAVDGLIYDWDIKNQTIERSQGITKLLGYLPEEAKPTLDWWLNLIHPDDLQSIRQALGANLISAERYSVEYRVRHKDGHYVYVYDQGLVERDEAGQAVRMVGSTKNITARKLSEEALQQSEARFRRLVESNLIGVIFWSVDGRVTNANDAFLEMVGYTREDLQADRVRWKDITPADQLDLSDRAIAEMRQSGTSTPLEKEYIRKDGSRVPILLGGVMFEGSQDQGVSFVVDLTELKRTEAALRQSEVYYRYLAEAIPIIVWTTDANGLTDYINQRWYELTGLTIKQGLGLNWQASVHPDDLPRVQQRWSEAQQSCPLYEVEYRLRGKDGVYRWQLVRGFSLKDQQNRIVKWFGTCTDIHDQKQLEEERARLLKLEQVAREEAEAASRTKDEFLAIVSHELRSPLNSILGWAKLLRTRTFDPATASRALETIERNAQAQAQLIEDLLDISRMIRGNLRLTTAPVNLINVVENAIEALRPAAEAKQVRLEFTLLSQEASRRGGVASSSLRSTRDTPILVLGDLTRLQQIVWNLLANAVKFTSSGGLAEVQLGVRKTADFSQFSAEIKVIDTGKGIHPDFLPYVFERFRQADRTTVRSQDGLGLGLAIVRQLVELHGGTVTADSPGEEQGATFTVMLPLLKPQTEENQDGEMTSQEASPSVSLPLLGLCILVVDDEPDAREFLTFTLEADGANVIVASSAKAALELLNPFKPDILVSDIGMPDEDGYSLIEQVRSLAPEQGGEIPAIALTAYAREEDRTRALSAGFQRHLAKPTEPIELITAIINLVTPP